MRRRIDPQQLKAAVRRLDEQLERGRENEKQLQEKLQKYDELRGVLDSLPEKVTHPVMVPFGPLAFFEGDMVHTNEVLVQLSSEWFALKTAKHACGTVDRRKERLRGEMAANDKQVKDVEQKRRFALSEGAAAGIKLGGRADAADPDGGDMLDIREPFSEESSASTQFPGGVPGATVSKDADGYFDIREPLEDEAPASSSGGFVAALASTSGGGSNIARLRELERLEEEEDEEEPDDPSRRKAKSVTFTSGESADGTNMARLRELERLEDQADLDELDDLCDSYERTGLPPGGVASASSPPAAESSDSGHGAGAEVHSPADLYRLMANVDGSVDVVSAPKPAIKPARPPAPVEAPRPTVEELPLGASGVKAFSGQILEHAKPAGTTGDAAAAVPQRVSKFKAARMAAGR